MEEISLKARAKINLNLDIVGRRGDGYHLLNMIMQQIDLYDVVSVKKTLDGISINTDCSSISNGKDNIAYKAAYEMMKTFNEIKGVEINIEKRIPIAAGLAGGSSDGASVILGLNEIYDLNLSKKELIDIGLKVGADVPFCLIGGCAAVSGIGEIVEPISGLVDKWILLSKPPINVSTKDAYLSFDLKDMRENFDFQEIIKIVENQKLEKFLDVMNNSLESVTINKYSVVAELKNKFKELYSDFFMMSGSGPTVFGIYENYDAAFKGYKAIKEYNAETYLVKTYNN